MRTLAALLFAVAAASCAGGSVEDSELRGQTFHTSLDPVSEPSPGEPAPPPEISASDYVMTGPYSHENLSVFLLQRAGVASTGTDYLTLEEGLRAGVLKITETEGGGQVNRLEVENRGDRPVYLQAGDTVKGGKQDRTIGIDLVLPPKSGRSTVDAFCVEPGRWASLETESSSRPRFAESEAPVATKEQKLAIKGGRSQAGVWDAGRRVTGQLGTGMADFPGVSTLSASYVIVSENPEVKKKVEGYTTAVQGILEGRENVVGMAYAVNGEMNTIELYASPALFAKLWPKLLKGASLEATAKQKEASVRTSPSASDVVSLLTRASKAEGRIRALPGDMRLKTYEGNGVALFDTEKGGELLHRQVILK